MRRFTVTQKQHNLLCPMRRRDVRANALPRHILLRPESVSRLYRLLAAVLRLPMTVPRKLPALERLKPRFIRKISLHRGERRVIVARIAQRAAAAARRRATSRAQTRSTRLNAHPPHLEPIVRHRRRHHHRRRRVRGRARDDGQRDARDARHASDRAPRVRPSSSTPVRRRIARIARRLAARVTANDAAFDIARVRRRRVVRRRG
mmetsp:Transcript_7644/g.25312  ORF Transcript_7644/g.25312 Transcript_7644/m.25312 type:complete len:205 (+) Transcript_7644:886-1500(+)